jgi:LysM repeat protein
MPVIGALALVVGIGACGIGDEKVGSTLPPLTAATTTTSSLPTTTTEVRYYVVQSGDSVSSIAASFGVSQTELVALNGIVDVDKIQAGQKLQLPPSTVVVTAPSTTALVATTVVTQPAG